MLPYTFCPVAFLSLNILVLKSEASQSEGLIFSLSFRSGNSKGITASLYTGFLNNLRSRSFQLLPTSSAASDSNLASRLKTFPFLETTTRTTSSGFLPSRIWLMPVTGVTFFPSIEIIVSPTFIPAFSAGPLGVTLLTSSLD